MKLYPREFKMTPRGVLFPTGPRGGLELWVPCIDFARIVRREKQTVVKWVLKRWIPGGSFGSRHFKLCFIPLNRALKAVKLLEAEGGTLRRNRLHG